MRKPITFITLYVLLFTVSVAGQQRESSVISGVHNSTGAHRLSPKQLQQVQDSLRHKSGFVELRFDETGALTLGNRQNIEGGSAIVRALLVASIDGQLAIELESHFASPDVIFGCLESGYVMEDDQMGQRIEVRPLKLDFYDFAQLQGDADLLAAFDIGMVTLHELTHGALRLRDDETHSKKLGACVKYMNQIRRELNLPERQQYAWDITRIKFTGSVQEVASIRFTLTTETEGRSKTKDYYLRWNTQLTGNRTGTNNTGLQAMATR